MTKLFASTILFSMMAFAVACSSNHSDSTPSQRVEMSESYSYQFNENGCDTDKQSFSSVADYCLGLQNENVNHGCALDLREDAFQRQQCPGEFQPF